MVSSPLGSKAILLTPGCGEGTYITDGPGQENGQLVSKRCKLPSDFQGRFLKAKLRVRAARRVISSWTLLRLVGGEVAG